MDNQNLRLLIEQTDSKAELAMHTITSYEKICTERYENINKQLEGVRMAQSKAADAEKLSIEKIYLSLDELKKTAYGARGIDIALRYMCLLLGAAGVIYGFTR